MNGKSASGASMRLGEAGLPDTASILLKSFMIILVV